MMDGNLGQIDRRAVSSVIVPALWTAGIALLRGLLGTVIEGLPLLAVEEILSLWCLLIFLRRCFIRFCWLEVLWNSF